MPVPVRDDGRPGPTRRLVVFVHGFCSARATWAPLRTCLEGDPAVTADFDLAFFEYETAVMPTPIVGALPTIEQCGKSLAAWLTQAMFRGGHEPAYIDVTLVGHSMGGIIIQACLLAMLRPDGGLRELQHLRQVILFATPNFGSVTLGAFRRLVSFAVDNPQERALRQFSPDAIRIHDEIRARVVFATQRARDQFPVPFYCFSGRADGIVRHESAMGYFPAGEPLPGGHADLHAPDDRSDTRYARFVNALLTPHGHQHIWEVEQFLFGVKVSPLPDGTQVAAHHGGRERRVTCDNVARIVRKVTFSAHNRCREPYVLKYGTRNGGWVVPTISEPHITPPDKLRLYEDTGTDAYYEVEPSQGSTSALTLVVYKGFDQGNRDYHMHLGRRTYFRRVVFEVDLSDYRAAGWGVTAPRLYFHLSDPGDHALCRYRSINNSDPPVAVDDAGVWRWELEHLTEGVVDLVFDVTPPRSTVSPRVITLQPGEHAIVGYGSLLSIASLEKTLGRSYTGPFLTCDLRGWRRRWNVAMPNRVFAYRVGDGWVTPDQVFYLNVEPDPLARLNAIVFVVSTDELHQFDAREWIYDRVDVSGQLPGLVIQGGAAWVYRGKPEHVLPHPATPAEGAIRRTYLDILRDGHRDLGASFAADFEATTEPVPPHLVVDDVRRPS